MKVFYFSIGIALISFGFWLQFNRAIEKQRDDAQSEILQSLQAQRAVYKPCGAYHCSPHDVSVVVQWSGNSRGDKTRQTDIAA